MAIINYTASRTVRRNLRASFENELLSLVRRIEGRPLVETWAKTGDAAS
jgi:hypothetical protein